MAIPNQTPYNIFTANGISTVFPYEFYLLNAFDLTVSINGVEQSSGFTISGIGNVNGGEVTFLTPPANGSVILLERVVPTYRLTEYQDNGDLLAETVNKDFDRLWMAIQQAFIYLGLALTRPLLGGPFNAHGYRIENLGDPVNPQDAVTKKWFSDQNAISLAKTLRVPETAIPQLPPISGRAGKLLAFDNGGSPRMVLPASGSATDVMLQLAMPDGMKHIGRCGSIEELITIEPEYVGQLISVSSYYGEPISQISANPGGGYFWYDREDITTPPNGGSVIVTNGGKRWKAVKTEFTPEDFGAIGGDEQIDTDSLQRLFDSKEKISPAMGTYYLDNLYRSSSGYDSWMTYNYVLKIDGFSGVADLSKATIVMPEGAQRITAIIILNSTGTIILPKIIGNMQDTVMPSGYIDDCAVRIGAGCKNLTVISTGIDHYPGHGIITRHYTQDGVATLDEGIPYDINIVATGVRHCWQSGIVPITGDTIRIQNSDVQFSGSTENANGRVATIGHNYHCESVAGAGGLNNRLRNIWIQNCNGFNARMHGLMAHTAIDNLNVLNNNFRYNVIDGGRFEAAAHKITSSGNHYSNNGGCGVTFNCGSLTAAGYPLLQHAATYHDVIENNGLDGFKDLSGSKSLVVSGSIGLNGGDGVIFQENGEQSLSNVTIFNNGKGATAVKYAINGGASSYSNVRIYNSAPEVNIQRAFNFRARSRVANVIVDENSSGFDVLDGHPAYFPANDGLLRLSGTYGTITGRRMLVNSKGAGAWLMPDHFDYIVISFTASADMFFPNPSSRNLLNQFSLEILSGSQTATVKVQSGTVNGTTQFAVSAGHVYSLRYTTPSNLQVTQIS
ncbi:phage tail fiber domain-containing protein [Serratia fonticola]|uniref:Tail spike TSP1/Gp66 N-terminal domain-containing protein n=1 Tax=Serratia fonticola TaxID=47917 RepID=A0AAW3WRG9_SERFO|nr:phage tail fiber protein [Serratia fonticola]MBC3213396.1 hypothetical protein [Serratia fonticola]NYA14255.1 hypothetical protein [Serratia fonticola]NYA33897.1 hypothetical protein [Serratia fonticola]